MNRVQSREAAAHLIDGHVAVLGAGTIGMSWAGLFLAHGLDVAIWDPYPSSADQAAATLQAQIATVQRLAGLSAPAGQWRIADTAAAAVEGAGFVQESGPEQLDAKRQLFASIDPALKRDAIVASSTSTLMPSILQQDCPFADRLIVGHPVNPPHLIPLVEVVGGQQTSEETTTATMRFYQALGKRPVRLHSERPGHLINRLQAALWREAVDAVASGLASVADVDAVLTHALALRWVLLGPHATFHLGGGSGGLGHFIDHLGPAFVALWNDLGQSELSPQLVSTLIAGVDAEVGGRDIAQLAAERDERLFTLLSTIRPIAADPGTAA